MSTALRPRAVPVLVVSGAGACPPDSLVEAIVAGAGGEGTLVLVSGESRRPRIAEALTLPAEAAGRLTGACLCCTGRDGLIAVLEDVLRRVDNHRMSPIDRLVIAADRDADPARLAGAIRFHPYLSLRYAPVAVLSEVARLDPACGIASDPDRSRIMAADWLVGDGLADPGLDEPNSHAPRLSRDQLAEVLARFWAGERPPDFGSEAQRRTHLSAAMRGPGRRS